MRKTKRVSGKTYISIVIVAILAILLANPGWLPLPADIKSALVETERNNLLFQSDAHTTIAQLITLVLAIAVVSAMGKSTINLMIAVGLASSAPFTRVARAAVLVVRDEEYVEAARAIGMRDWQIILDHILPNCVSQIIVQATLRVGSAIISAAQLSFLGLGVPAPAPEWGSMLSTGRQFIRDYSYMTLFPGLAIMLCVLSLNLLGDGLRDALDPKLKR